MCMGAHTCVHHITHRASRQQQQDIEQMQALLQPHRIGSRGRPSLHLSCLGSELWRAGLNGSQVLKETILKQNILERGLQVVAPRLALHCFSPDSRLCHTPQLQTRQLLQCGSLLYKVHSYPRLSLRSPVIAFPFPLFGCLSGHRHLNLIL